MMSPENIPPPPENDAATRKTAPPKQPHEQPQKCPRCDSANTKFCYYNNYSLTQPRHFCKTCRRYWTRGGALRNVPIGGGCRKTKKLRTSSSSTTTSNSSPTAKIGGGVEFGHGFKFLNPNLNPSSLGCTSPAAAGMEFQLGGFSLPKLHPATAGVYTQYVTSSVPPPGHGTGAGPYFGLDLLAGLNYSPSSPPPPPPPAAGNENPISISSIESLSSINQEMHWKLQQQRLAMIYGRGDDHEEHKINDQEKLHHQDTTQGGSINLFKNLEINNNNNNNNNGGERKMNVGPTEWLFDQIQTSSAANHGNYGTNCTSNNVNEVAGSNLHGVWGDLNHHNHHQQQLQFHGLE